MTTCSVATTPSRQAMKPPKSAERAEYPLRAPRRRLGDLASATRSPAPRLRTPGLGGDTEAEILDDLLPPCRFERQSQVVHQRFGMFTGGLEHILRLTRNLQLDIGFVPNLL